MSSLEVKVALDGRRLLTDQLRRCIETRLKDAELLESYKEYRELLDKAQPLVERLKEREDRYYAYFHPLRRDIHGANALGKAEVGLRA